MRARNSNNNNNADVFRALLRTLSIKVYGIEAAAAFFCVQNKSYGLCVRLEMPHDRRLSFIKVFEQAQ